MSADFQAQLHDLSLSGLDSSVLNIFSVDVFELSPDVDSEFEGNLGLFADGTYGTGKGLTEIFVGHFEVFLETNLAIFVGIGNIVKVVALTFRNGNSQKCKGIVDNRPEITSVEVFNFPAIVVQDLIPDECIEADLLAVGLDEVVAQFFEGNGATAIDVHFVGVAHEALAVIGVRVHSVSEDAFNGLVAQFILALAQVALVLPTHAAP